MGELRPVKQPSRVAFEFTYDVDPSWVEQVIDEVGQEPSTTWQVEFDLGEISSPDLRRRLRLVYERYMDVEGYPVLPVPTDKPEEFVAGVEQWLDTAEKEEEEAAREVAANSKREALEKQVFSADMEEWALEHGSARLRTAIERGYKANRTYAVERAAAEFPEFWVDTSNDLEWNERVDPSEAALNLETRVRKGIENLGLDDSLSTRIVWLTEAPRTVDQKLDSMGGAFEPQEAIVVAPYLGRYALAMPIDPEHRVPVEVTDEADD